MSSSSLAGRDTDTRHSYSPTDTQSAGQHQQRLLNSVASQCDDQHSLVTAAVDTAGHQDTDELHRSSDEMLRLRSSNTDEPCHSFTVMTRLQPSLAQDEHVCCLPPASRRHGDETHSLSDATDRRLVVIDDVEDCVMTGHDDVEDCVTTSHSDIKDCVTTRHDDIKDCVTTGHDDTKDCVTTRHGDIDDCVTTSHNDIKDCMTACHDDIKDCVMTCHDDMDDCVTTSHNDIKDCMTTCHDDTKGCASKSHDDIKDCVATCKHVMLPATDSTASETQCHTHDDHEPDINNNC